MPYVVKPGVIGVTIMPRIEGDGRSLEELLYDATQAVLKDAGITVEEIDGIVVASNDQYDGRAISIMMASGSVGGVDRDILSTPSAGEHAFVLGALRVACGQYRTQLVLSWSPTEASSIPEAQRLAADPYFHRRLPMDEQASHALQASALMAQVPGLEAAAAAVLEKNRAHGKAAYPDLVAQADANAKPTRWPLPAGSMAPPVTGVVAILLAGEDFIREKNMTDPAWIAGMGWTTEPAFLGDRDLGEAAALREAARQAYAEAGIDGPLGAVQVAEVSDATPFQELMAYEALGLAPRGEWAALTADKRFGADGSLPVNLSGGVTCLNPVYCTGLIRIAEVANQVRGKAGRHQKQGVTRGLAQASSGMAMQYQTVVVLDREQQGAAA
ncbi:thiolase family protein [Roseomonas haemaphysalidis]|uniref:Thiolase family protein n=1 Tax=Roseomonas haemaphysalidis TaxID=2768162 RepID=A0ABS3KV00_9PROT|nr:thiolase family protein [Roseomonas haemaphysalidis]MBO1081311.1 thiolase family protein [Roseomonas haemaphysalidis]